MPEEKPEAQRKRFEFDMVYTKEKGMTPSYKGDPGASYQKGAKKTYGKGNVTPEQMTSAVYDKTINYLDVHRMLEPIEHDVGKELRTAGTVFVAYGKITEKGLFKEKAAPLEDYAKGGGDAPAFYVTVQEFNTDQCGRIGAIGKVFFLSEQDGQKMVQEMKAVFEGKDIKKRQEYVNDVLGDVIKASDGVYRPKDSLAKNVIEVNMDSPERGMDYRRSAASAIEVKIIEGASVTALSPEQLKKK